jgi:hypothetical protein
MKEIKKMKCHKKTPWRSILNKQNRLFFKNREKEGKTGFSGGWYQWERGRYKERVKEAECSGNIMYSCMKMKK